MEFCATDHTRNERKMIYRDETGREIMRGDLIRSPHFRGARRKQYYLYHVVTVVNDGLYCVPTARLDDNPFKPRQGGACWLQALADDAGYVDCRILCGFDNHGNSFEDRKKIRKITAAMPAVAQK